jgi:hypothetical protein
VNLTLLYVNSGVVIPAKAGIQLKKTGFRIRSGMTEYVKRFLKHYTIVSCGLTIEVDLDRLTKKLTPPLVKGGWEDLRRKKR